jgi:hypothetical protein
VTRERETYIRPYGISMGKRPLETRIILWQNLKRYITRMEVDGAGSGKCLDLIPFAFSVLRVQALD